MPKMKFAGVGAGEANAEAGSFAPYEGPNPPAGIYKVRLKFLRVKENSKGDPMLHGVAEIAESSKAKSKYSGFSVWINQNITPQGAGYINPFLDVLGITRKVFWTQGVVLDSDDPPNVLKCGTWKFSDDIEFRVNTKKGSYNDQYKLDILSYLPLTEAEQEDEDESDDDFEEEDEDEEYDEDEETDEEEDEEVEEDDEEEDEEPEPAPKRRKAPPAKKAVKPARKAKAKPVVEEDDDDDDDDDDDEPPF